MFRNIIWDVDGTLFDTYPAIAGAFHAALHELGQDVSISWITGLAKVSLGSCATALAEIARTNADTIVDHYDAHYSRVSPCDQPPFPGVRAICEGVVARGGKNVIVTHRGRDGTAELLKAHHMDGLFAGAVTRDDGFARKPDPAAFAAAVARYELDPAETITVGDRDIDIQAGRELGIFTCLFGAPANGLRPNLIIQDYAQLEEFLRQHKE